MRTLIWKSLFIGKKAILWFVYLLFTLYIIYLVAVSQSLGAKLTFGCIGILALNIVVLFEYLKISYEKMIAALTIECDINKAMELRDGFEKKDILHGFKQSLMIFDGLLFLDQKKYDTCLNHLNTHKNFFHGTLDYLFIYYHTQLYCFIFLDDNDQIQDCLKKLIKLQTTNSKKTSHLFSQHELLALKYFYQQRNSKSLAEFNQIDQHRLNNRELTYILFFEAQCLLALNKKSEGYRKLKESKKIGNTIVLEK